MLISAAASARETIGGPFYYRWGSSPAGDGRPAWALQSAPDGEWTEVAEIVDVPQRGGTSLWLATEIDADEGDTLYVPRTYLGVAVYADGELLLDDDHPDAGGRAYRLVDLPAGFRRGWLSLHVTSTYSKTGMAGPLAIGTRSEHLVDALRRDAPSLLVTVLLVLTALGSLGLAWRRVQTKAAIGLALWATSVAVWTLFYTRTRELWLPSPSLWLTLWAGSLSLVAPSFLLFFNSLFQRGERSLTGLLYATAVGGVIGFGMRLVGAPLVVSNPYLAAYRVLIGAIFVAVGVIVVRRWREGSRDAKIFALGFVTLMVAGLRDVLVSLGVVRAFGVTSNWGHAAFIATAAWLLVERLGAMRRALDRYAAAVAVHATEREMMLRDMHDGLGRITTGIGMLAEAAKRDPDRVEPLTTIASLAEEGSSEIRTFMQGLDDDGRDWESLAATLRQRTGALVEAAGGHYDFAAEIDPDVLPPTALLYVHLLRVAQEGVTNALKHAEQPQVDVELQVGAQAIRLVVENDGVAAGKARHGVNLGAGLKNMQARAEQLGGDLDLAVDDERAQLRLQIPLPLRYASPRR